MRPSNFQGNIHVINFPISTTAGELAALFDDYGLVLGAHIKTITSEGGHLRLGIVAMAPDKAADTAIEALQGFVIGGQKLKLKRPKPQPKPVRKAGAQPRRKERIERQERPHGSLSLSAEPFPANAPSTPPRKVIVEYRNRRGTRLINT